MTTPIGRAHLHLPILDATGAVYSSAQVTFNDPDTGAPTTEPIYVQASGSNPITQPLFCDPAVIDVWTDNAIRVDIVATVPGNVRVDLQGIDIRPDADLVVSAPGPMRLSGSQNTSSALILSSLGPNDASFQVVDVASTHQHQGDSANSVVLTGEAATDFDPNQTWVGYHAGENPANNSTSSSALGALAELNGTSATILGLGEVTTQLGTGVTGDFATLVSTEDSNATSGSTVLGAANLTRQGTSMTVVGAVNGTSTPTDPTLTPNNTTVVGSGNIANHSGQVKLGANHPASSAKTNQTVIGNGNSAQAMGLPWSADEKPVALGQNISMAGDPSTATSADDWFGGVSPLAYGKNDTAFNPSLVLLQGNAATQGLLQTTGHATIAGFPTTGNVSQTLGFYGNTGTTRPKINYNSTDVFHQSIQDVLNALAQTGLILTNTVPVVTESGTHPDGTALEFAETGQALQWSYTPASTMYLATNPFLVSANKITLKPGALAGYPIGQNRGYPALYGCGIQDQVVQGQFVFNQTATNLITNPDFETNTSGWSPYDGTTIAISGTRCRYNSNSLRITPSGTVAGARATWQTSGTVGTTYNWSAWVYPTSNRQCRIAIDGYSSGGVFQSTFAKTDVTLPVGTWSRISVVGTVPSGSPNLNFNVGYFSTNGNPASSELIYVDGAQITVGSTLYPFVDSTGYSPDDQYTGLMVRSYLAKSGSGSGTTVTPTGYLMGRTAVYSMTGLTKSQLTTLSTPLNTGDVAKIIASGTSITFWVNGVQVASITDSTNGSRVKCGFRVNETTSVYNFSVYPT